MSSGSTSIVGSMPASPGARPCCVMENELEVQIIWGRSVTVRNFVDLSDPLDHQYGAGNAAYARALATIAGLGKGGEFSGLVYTCRLGFLDLGHVRDCIDLTRFYYEQIRRKPKAASTFPPVRYTGTVTIKTTIPAGDQIGVAASMSYDTALFHELYTWYEESVGGHNSSFSPEDLVSNLAGTHVAVKALTALAAGKYGGDFDRAATAELKVFLTAAGAVPVADTTTAFTRIDGLWVSGSFHDVKYLRRRNFDVSPVVPWLVPSLSFCTATSIPTGFATSIPAAMAAYYEMELTIPSTKMAVKRGKTRLKVSDFPAEITVIRTDAAGRPEYGPRYDKPT